MRLVRQFILDAEVEAIGPLSPAQIARLERTEVEKAGAAAEKELDNAKKTIYVTSGAPWNNLSNLSGMLT